MLDDSTKTQLRLRRQFVLSASEGNCAGRFPSWRRFFLRRHVLYAHPELSVEQTSRAEAEATLVGYLIDPRSPQLTSRDILTRLLGTATTFDEIFDLTKPYGGRWALIVRIDRRMVAFTDPVGLRQLFYTAGQIAPAMCASQPGVIAEALRLQVDTRAVEEFLKPQMEVHREYWWPGNSSPYKEVRRLTPNHYLDLDAMSVHRFWPRARVSRISLAQGVSETSDLLKGLLLSASKRFPLALPMSAGIDSRMMLAASRDVRHTIYHYTLIFHNSPTRRHPDVTVPSRLLARLGLRHHIIESQHDVDPDFEKIFFENVPYARKALTPVAYGLFNKFPSDHVAVKGHCGELARCFFYGDGYPKERVTVSLLATLGNMGPSRFAQEQLAAWLREADAVEASFGVPVLDLFYWEQRLGSWLPTGQLELDIAQEIFTPMNCREILEIFLSVDVRYRSKPDYQFTVAVIRELWPEVLLAPINPKPLRQRLRSLGERCARRVGIYGTLRSTYHLVRGLIRQKWGRHSGG